MVRKSTGKTKAKSPAKSTAKSTAKSDDFPAFAADRLMIRSKDGAIIPLELNAVQRLVHARLEAALKAYGRVRALILKARQPGVSTYVEARFYWQVTRRRGVRAYILTHLRDATDAIWLRWEFSPRSVREAARLHRPSRKARTFLSGGGAFPRISPT